MVHILEEAEEHLNNLLAEGSQKSVIRVAIMGGAHGPVLGLIIDETGEDDLCFEHNNIPLVVDKKLMTYCQSITIGFRVGKDDSCGGGNSGSGFLINSENPLNL